MKTHKLEQKFLRLLHSPEKVNVQLAFEIAQQIPELSLERHLENYQILWDQTQTQRVEYSNMFGSRKTQKIGIAQIVEFNLV